MHDTVDKLHTESERYGMHIVKTKTMVFGKKPEENDAKVNRDGQAIENVKALYILDANLHEIMTVSKTYKDYFSNSSVQRVTIYMERQWDND